jgi:hypothetical protein
MPDYTNTTAANYTTATTPTLEEIQATMRQWTQDRLARVCRFNLSARKNPCYVCGAVMEMNDREEIGVCEHVMAAIRRQCVPPADLPMVRPTIWPIGSPMTSLRIYVKQGKE